MMVAERKIGELTYRCEKLPAFQTLQLGRRVANIVGGALPALAGALARTPGDLPADADDEAREAHARAAAQSDMAALSALGGLAERIDHRFEALVKEMAEGVEVKWNGAWMPVDVEQEELIQSDAGTLLLVAFFALEVRLKSFFSGALATRLRAPATSGSRLNS